MRKAFGISKYGTWPRTGESGFAKKYKNGTGYEGDFNHLN